MGAPTSRLAVAFFMTAILSFIPISLLESSSQDGEDPRPVSWQVVEALIREGNVTQPSDVVLDHMRSIPSKHKAVGNRLSRVCEALKSPWQTPPLAEDLRDALARPFGKRRTVFLEGWAADVVRWLDLDPHAFEFDGLQDLEDYWQLVSDPELRGVELLETLSEMMSLAHALIDEALGDLPVDERDWLFENHLAFCDAWYRSHHPSSNAEEQPTEAQQQLIGQAMAFHRDQRFDRSRVLAVADILVRFAVPDHRRSLAKRLKGLSLEGDPPDGFEGSVDYVVGDEPHQRVVLGGRGKTTYNAPAALIIDLGGSDTYRRAAVVDSRSMLASVVLDLSGNDLYETDRPGPAYSVFGAAVLIDVQGKDTYKSTRLGQGASAWGVAMALDLKGNDSYRLHDYGQGHGLCGIGVLYDQEGDDTYEAWAFAQGGGIGYGLSALVDGEGDDQYLADGHWPDVYGNSGEGSYHGASQGYATGMRRDVAGGLGVLLDLGEGKDRYQSGNFSQGGGYYFSFGLMYDGGGDDENFGYRYSQGFGVHQAVGIRWDVSGDDRYKCQSVAHAGMAWDEGVGFFLDDEGDDVYQVGGLGLGSAAQTGVAFFIDGDGTDKYRGRNNSQGDTGGSEYHQKPSIGIMIDLGGGDDDYKTEGRANGTSLIGEGVGIFVDTKMKTLPKLLRDVSRGR